MRRIGKLIDEIINKRKLKDNEGVITIRNRLTHEVMKVKVDASKLKKLSLDGWYWSSELYAYLIFDNKQYYPNSDIEKRCGMMDKNCWVVIQGHIPA